MRWIGWLLLLLVAVGWLAAEVPLSGTPPATGLQTDWRRTRDGWQRMNWLSEEVPLRRPALHPGLVALFVLLLSVTALVAFSTSTARFRRRTILQRNLIAGNKFRRRSAPKGAKNRRDSRFS